MSDPIPVFRADDKTSVTQSAFPEAAETSEVGYYIRRPTPAPTVPVVLGARSVIWRRFAPGEQEDNLIRPWVKLLWCVRGNGIVRMEGSARAFPPEHIALFFPGMRHEAWCDASRESVPWEVRWLTLDGPLCEPIVRAMGFTGPGIWQVGPPPVYAFENLRSAIAGSVTPAGERLADVAAHAILAVAANNIASSRSVDTLIQQALEMIQTRWGRPDFGVEQMAHALLVHRSVLSRRFHAQTGVAPSEYVANLRIQHALSLLRTTELPVREVARRCGYADADYFTRSFRRLQGVTPGAYRKDRG